MSVKEEPHHIVDEERMLHFLANRSMGTQARDPDVNSFRALGVGDRETTHSRFIRWLLTPGASHGQGVLFLSVFLDLCDLEISDETLEQRFTSTDCEARGLEARIDIMVQIPGEFMVYIENKINAAEGHEQTQREFRDLQRHAEAHLVRPDRRRAIYLTPSGDRPEGDAEDNWLCMSHGVLADGLSSVLDSVRDQRTRLLVEDWINTVRDGGMTSMPEFSGSSMDLIQHWDAVCDILVSFNELEAELTAVREALAANLKKQQWWTRGWKIVSDKPGQLYVSYSKWKVGKQYAIWIGLDAFVSDYVMGTTGPAGLYLWVSGGRRELADRLGEIISRQSKHMVGDLDSTSSTVVTEFLPICTIDNCDQYLSEVLERSIHFIGHYATLLLELDPPPQTLINEHW